MKNLVKYIVDHLNTYSKSLNEDKFTEYETKCAKHIINVLSKYINLNQPISESDYLIIFESSIKQSDLQEIEKELCKVLASHEVTVSNNLIVNIFKEPQLVIENNSSSNTYMVYFKGYIAVYYAKNIK